MVISAASCAAPVSYSANPAPVTVSNPLFILFVTSCLINSPNDLPVVFLLDRANAFARTLFSNPF